MDHSPDKRSGCGLLNAMFGKKSMWPKRSTSTGSIAMMNEFKGNNDHNNMNKIHYTKSPSWNSKRRRDGSEEGTSRFSAPPHQKIPPPANGNANSNHHYQQQNNGSKPCSAQTRSTPPTQQNMYGNQGRRVPKEAIGISGELESMIADHQKANVNASLVRASSGNVMLYGNLGNLRQGGGGGCGGGVTSSNQNVINPSNGKHPGSGLRNGVKNTNYEEPQPPSRQQPVTTGAGAGGGGTFCRALSTRMDPETLKIMGNEDYKNGNFAEALALYETAISIDPNKASYRSNKSAALTALGRILDAVFECREALRIDPRYHRAHHRIANLYLRLGEAEKAIYHYKQAGPDADRDDIAKAKTLQLHLNKCTEAKRLRDWNTLVKETMSTINDGADSAPQIFALQAEALLKLHRHQEAEEALSKGPNFPIEACTQYFGPIGNANLLVVRAQVDMACGRFDSAMTTIQRAVKLDASNKEVTIAMRKGRSITIARTKGNELFKASRFSEASAAYEEGLDYDSHNSVLLCNRAACRSKLGQYDKAVQDCTIALNVRPSYIKARLRRADCNAKLKNWEASIQDYEILQRDMPDDEEVNKGLSEAKLQLGKQHRQES